MIKFTLKENSKTFSDISFVLSARQKGIIYNQRLEYQKYLFVDEDYLFCTDGPRLHLVKREKYPKFEPGFWKIIKHNKKEIMLEELNNDELKNPLGFLNYYKMVIAPLFSVEKEKEFIIRTNVHPIYGISLIISDLYKKLPGLCLNLEYVKDIFQDYQEFNIYGDKDDEFKPFVFKNSERFALLMQIRNK